MSERKDNMIQWVFVAMLFVPTFIFAEMRLHHRNFALFVLLSVICTGFVWFAYFAYLKKTGYQIEEEEEIKVDTKIRELESEDD